MAGMVNLFNSPLGRVLVALIVPVAWGILSAWLFDRVRARRESAPPRRRARGRR
jgi:hypothetical protein